MGDARGGAACAAAAYDDAPRVHDAGRRDGISPENRSQQKSPKIMSIRVGRQKFVGVESESCSTQLLLSLFFLWTLPTKTKVENVQGRNRRRLTVFSRNWR